uniref:Serpentine receptor class gamma n=1 Tax=Parastrongyloides trichosuri TaxID=131310 RepID=A0A0N4Z161_PARTI
MNFTFVDGIQIFYGVPSFLFYVSIQFFLGNSILRGHSEFKNEFYPLIFFYGFVDLNNYIAVIIFFDIPSWGLFTDFYVKHQLLAEIGMFLLSTNTYIIILSNLVITTNRFVSISYPYNYDKIFCIKNLYKILSITCTLAISLNFPRLLYRGRYKYFNEYDVSVFLYDNNNVNKAYYVGGAFLSGTVFLVSLFLNISNLYKIINLEKGRINHVRADLHLAIYAAILAIGLICLNAYYVIRGIGAFMNDYAMYQCMLPHFGWIIDIIVFGSVWSLFIIR